MNRRATVSVAAAALRRARSNSLNLVPNDVLRAGCARAGSKGLRAALRIPSRGRARGGMRLALPVFVDTRLVLRNRDQMMLRAEDQYTFRNGRRSQADFAQFVFGEN